MRKYSFLVYHQEYYKFLNNLGDMGMVDIVEKQTELDEETTKILDQLKLINDSIDFLKRRDVDAKKPESEFNGLDVMKDVRSKRNELESLGQKLNALDKEINQVEPWGDFSWDTLNKLKEAGLTVRFFVISEKKFDPEWKKQFNAEIISIYQSQTHFIVVQEGNEEIYIEAEEVKPPQRSLSEVITEKKQVEARIEDINKDFNNYAATAIPALKKAADKTEYQADYDKILLNTNHQADGKVKVLEGFVPIDKREDLDPYLEENKILYISQQPHPEEHPPVELKNGRFARLFEPIGKLFSLPSYGEIDLTPLFAPFFMMFFGFCLGDAGYGLIFIILGFVVKPRVKPNMKPILTLVQFLGIGTLIFGVLTGTFFGMNLLKADIPALESMKSFMLDSQQSFYHAVIIGVIQILFGIGVHAVNRFRQFGIQYALPQIGWLLLLPGLGVNFGLDGLALVGNILIFGGIALILFFSEPKANVFARIGKGLWDLYNITGVFGDVLSYIRLFALGVSSAILGFVINAISMSINQGLPYVGPVLMVIVLVIGHTANIFISSLGAFVHPMRLTFVEFYKNAGFSGGGKEYKPFKNKL